MDKEQIIEAQREVIASMKAYHELALKKATDLEKSLEGVYPPENSQKSEIERAERRARSFKRRGIPTK